MSHPLSSHEPAVQEAVRSHVLTRVGLGIYDPTQPRRPRVDVLSFEIELLEFDDDSTVHAAGPVQLQGPDGEVEQFLRISLPVTIQDGVCTIPEDAPVRAAYIMETDHPNGACRETAALANV